MTTSNNLMVAVLERLKYCQGVLNDQGMVRREHRTNVTRATAPAVYLVDGDESPDRGFGKCETQTELAFTVRVFVRSDDGFSAADEIAESVMEALDPAVPYPHGAQLARGRVSRDQEIADLDVVVVEMDFVFRYVLAGWGM